MATFVLTRMPLSLNRQERKNIKCLWDGKTKEALNVLNGLIKPIK
ncbi:MAG: hypothetical protein PHE47_01230 [Oscillospiraceae bacterium]|nr:hypothetical protein [Oscillospiraceae bacterium]